MSLYESLHLPAGKVTFDKGFSVNGSSGEARCREYDGVNSWWEPIALPVRMVSDPWDLRIGYLKVSPGVFDQRVVPLGDPVPPRPSELDQDGNPAFKPCAVLPLYHPARGVMSWGGSSITHLAAVEQHVADFVSRSEAECGMLPLIELCTQRRVSGSRKFQKTFWVAATRIVGFVERTQIPDFADRRATVTLDELRRAQGHAPGHRHAAQIGGPVRYINVDGADVPPPTSAPPRPAGGGDILDDHVPFSPCKD